MADIKISELPAGTVPLDGTEQIPVTQNGVTVRVDAADLVAAPADGSTTVQIYVSQANGSDSNDGLTPGTALATAQAYIDQFSTGPGWGVIFHFDSGNHVQFVFPPGWGRTAPVWMFGDGAGQAGDDGYIEVRAAEAALAGSTESVITTSGSITNVLVTNTLEVTSGAAIGAMRHINRVDGDDIYVSRSIAGFVSGDTFRVVRAGAIVQIATEDVLGCGIGLGGNVEPVWAAVPPLKTCLGVVNMRWDVLDSTARGSVLDNCVICAFGLELAGSQVRMVGMSRIYAAASFVSHIEAPYSDGLPYIAAADPGNPVDDAAIDLRWIGWGVSIVPGGSAALSNIAGYLVQPPNTSTFFRGGEATLQGGSGGVSSGQGQRVNVAVGAVGGAASWYALDQSSAQGSFSSAYSDGVIWVTYGSNGIIEVTNAAGPAVKSYRGAYITVGMGTFTSGSGPGGVVDSMGRLQVASPGVITGSNPGVNDCNNGNVDIPFASLVSGVPFAYGAQCIMRE